MLFDIIRHVAADTVSNLFGILDGACPLEGAREDLLLTSQSDNRPLNGGLQDLFLEAEEHDRRLKGE